VENYPTYPQVFPQAKKLKTLIKIELLKVFHIFHSPYYYYHDLFKKLIEDLDQAKKIKKARIC